jgi:hypothetical protein
MYIIITCTQSKMSSLMTETENQMLCGEWNEAGLVESLDRKGFTPIKGLLELFANSVDADALQIITDVSADYIKIIDDGKGMNKDKLKNMFSMFRGNNSEKNSMGVSGLGGKEGMYILSKKPNKEPTTVVLFTYQEGGEYLKAIIPWKEIFDDKIYRGKIVVASMSAEEISVFENERTESSLKYGTTIRFEYNDDLKNLIETQFDSEKMCKLKLNSEDRCDIVFGQANIEIILKKSDGTPNLTINKYNYFSGNDCEFYKDKKCDLIDFWVDDKGEDRYIYHSEAGDALEISKDARGCSNIPTPIKIHRNWEKQGVYEIRNGMRSCKDIFDPAQPFTPSSAAMNLNPYDKKYFGKADVEYTKDILSGCSIVRNSQFITNIPYSDKTFNSKTSRAGFSSMLNGFYHRTEISYVTLSKQNNRMDKAMGIQENKNQHQKVLPLRLERLIIYLKKQHIEAILEYFDRVVKLKADQDKKKREIEAERRRLENEQKRLEEEKKRIEEELARRTEELSKPRTPEPPVVVSSEESDNEESDDEESEHNDSEDNDSDGNKSEHNESDDEESVCISVDSKEATYDSSSDSEDGNFEQENLDELKNKFLEKFAAEHDYEKVRKLYEMYNAL